MTEPRSRRVVDMPASDQATILQYLEIDAVMASSVERADNQMRSFADMTSEERLLAWEHWNDSGRPRSTQRVRVKYRDASDAEREVLTRGVHARGSTPVYDGTPPPEDPDAPLKRQLEVEGARREWRSLLDRFGDMPEFRAHVLSDVQAMSDATG